MLAAAKTAKTQGIYCPQNRASLAETPRFHRKNQRDGTWQDGQTRMGREIIHPNRISLRIYIALHLQSNLGEPDKIQDAYHAT